MSYLPPPTDQSTTFPSDADQQRLRQLIFLRANPKKGTAPPEMSDDDRWSWHAYTYAFRRVFLGQFDRRSPVDEQGDWFNHGMVVQAERFYRLKYNRPPPEKPRDASGQDAVRTDWRRVRAHDLTDAERKIAAPEIARMSREAQFNIDRIKRVPREPGDLRTKAREIPPPPPLADPDDPAVLEWMRRMGEEL